METPICDFVQRYAVDAALRLHMPGHKGLPLLGPEPLDLTEISGADVLYQPEGIIRQSEENAAALFGSARTVYSAEGSSLSIRAMLFLALQYAHSIGRSPRIAAARNAHKVFLTASALLDLEIDWLYPEDSVSLLRCVISPARLESYFAQCEALPAAVYITSPDYLGNVADIAGLAAVCHARGVLLLVDNAHGAYLHFLPAPVHPLDLGADLCCDSAHKTLPVLTGGGYLHIAHGAPALLSEQADDAMALFASTSPSYLILQSLDLANRCLAEGYRERLAAAAERWAKVRAALIARGWCVTGDEPMKLTLLPKAFGYTGTELAEYLAAQHMECEFSDPDHLVLMLSPDWEDADAQAVERLLSALPRRPAIMERPPRLAQPERVLSPRAALFSPSAAVTPAQAVGKVMASASISCPPAIPIVACGERITSAAAKAMEYYGIRQIRVVNP